MAQRVSVVRDGAEALDYLYQRGNYARATTAFSRVLLDLKMPKSWAWRYCARSKASEIEGIPVVMMTSSREEQDLVQSYQLGVNSTWSSRSSSSSSRVGENS